MKRLLSILVMSVSTLLVANVNDGVKNVDHSFRSEKKVETTDNPHPVNGNVFMVKYRFLASDYIFASISHNTWQNMAFAHDTKTDTEFRNFLYPRINNFHKIDATGSGGSILESDIMVTIDIISWNYPQINRVFLNKSNDSVGIVLRTDRNHAWGNGGSDWWGPRVNDGNWE